MTSCSRCFAAVGAAALLAIALTACSSAGGNPTNATPSVSQQSSTSGAGSTPNSGGEPSNVLGQGPGGPLDVSKLCSAVPLADVQKLVKATVGPATAATALLGTCQWGEVTASIYRDDTAKKYYNGGSVYNGTPVSGVGDVAQWGAAVPLATAPSLAAQKGSLTVTIDVGGEVADTTLSYTGSSGSYRIGAASNAKYIDEEGQICNDIFAAAG